MKRKSLKSLSLKKFIKSTKGTAYKPRVLKWFKQNLRKIVTSKELTLIPGKDEDPIAHNIRRIFELRDEDGYKIYNHKDNNKANIHLKTDEWMLMEKKPNPLKKRSRGVNKKIMYDVFTRDDNRCKFCGRSPQDDDPFRPGHKIILHVGHIVAHKRKSETEFIKVENVQEMTAIKALEKKDFVTMCNVCNEGAKNNTIKILAVVDIVMKSSLEHQKQIYIKLKKKFST